MNGDVAKGSLIGPGRLGAVLTLPSFFFGRDIAGRGGGGRRARRSGSWRLAPELPDDFLELLIFVEQSAILGGDCFDEIQGQEDDLAGARISHDVDIKSKSFHLLSKFRSVHTSIICRATRRQGGRKI